MFDVHILHFSFHPLCKQSVAFVYQEVMDYVEMSGEVKYGEEEKIVGLVEGSINNLARRGKIEFSEEYLIGKLVNILDDDVETARIISTLSLNLTGKAFSPFFGGKELIEIFQAMRPALMKLYSEKSRMSCMIGLRNNSIGRANKNEGQL